MNRQLIFFALLLLFFWPEVKAQNSTSSPLTVFGIGELEIRDFGRTTGMGSVGIGFQSNNFLNRRNPAGLTGIDTLRFILDVSAGMKFSEFFTSTRRARTLDFTFKTLAVGMRLSKKWTSSVGLCPYSNVGYQLSRQQTVPGTDENTNAVYSGEGGINNFYWANSYELFRGFSLGVTSSYLFGNYSHNAEEDIITIKDSYQIGKINFNFGIQYAHWFGQKTNITIGGVYGYQSKMPIEHKQMITSGFSVKQNLRKPDVKSYIPEMYGAGFSILRNHKAAEWILAADYQFRNWSVDPSRLKSMTYSDSRTYSVGIQLSPYKNRPEKNIDFIRFYLGACYNQSYLKINGFQMEDYSVSLGVGLPFYNYRSGGSPSFVNIAVNAGESGTGQRGGISERYILLTVNLSLVERWFAKRKWD